MNPRINTLAIAIMLLTAFPLLGGEGRFMVFFADKNGNDYSLERPQEFLTQASLRRRQVQGIALDDSDLPVSETYLGQLRNAGARVYFSSKWLNAALAEADSSLAADLYRLPFVEKVEFIAPESVLRSSAARSGSKSTEIRSAEALLEEAETDFQNKMLGIDEMHRQGYRGSGRMIGVFDSGFTTVDSSPYFSHLFSEGRIAGTRDFIRNSGNVYQYDSHGTRVLSVLAGYRSGQYVGAAHEASYLLCVTEDVRSEYRIEEYNWLLAAEYADSMGVDIINASVGYYDFDDSGMNYRYDQLDGKTTVITRAANMAAAKGILVVCSNGNEGNSPWKYLSAPADAASVLAIGAVGPDLNRSAFSSFGPTADGRIKPDLSALGSWTRLVQGQNVLVGNGTSFASPLVAGLAAGFWQAFPELTAEELSGVLKETASNAASPDTLTGFGVPHFLSAYNRVRFAEEDKFDTTFILFPNPVDERRIIYIYDDAFSGRASADVRFIDLEGRLLGQFEVDLSNRAQPLELDVSFLRPGTYILTTACGGVQRRSKLVVL
jgi:serine protease AprX